MKNIRPSLWAVAILALGTTLFLFLVLNNREVNIQPATSVQASNLEPVVSEAVVETVIIPGQPAVPEQPEMTNAVMTNSAFKAGFTGFEVK